ncbi:hypothetical protein [Allorhodopirellula heiligendammensis]|uniref:hypothetical protein n=1 Tax=Allorhodopirellula heiligendammensis TaxID=2714739 RepID=UPI00265EAAA2|nr:hypothetical protein [Allorhodopirellula heiligendammensis]
MRSIEELDNVLMLSSLKEVAKSLGVSCYRLSKWKLHSKELQSGRPYHFGKCVFELLTAKIISTDNLKSMPSDGKHSKAQEAVAVFIAARAFDAGATAEVLGPALSDPSLTAVLKEGDPQRIATAIRMSAPQGGYRFQPLRNNESAVIAVASPKTAALFSDRVWCMDMSVPLDVGFRCGTLEERLALGLMDGMFDVLLDQLPDEEQDAKEWEILEKMASLDVESKLATIYESMLQSPLAKASGRNLQPFVGSGSAYSHVLSPGDFQVVSASIESMELIDEEKLSWEQVMEVRRDSKARRSLRRFLNWLDLEYSGKPADAVKDAICLRFEDYNEALKKHGLTTKTGVLSSAYDASLFLSLFALLAEGDPSDLTKLVAGSILGIHALEVVMKVLCVHSAAFNLHPTEPIAYLHMLSRLPETKMQE